MAPSHYLNRCWVIANCTLGNKLQWNFNQNTKQKSIWKCCLLDGRHFVQGEMSWTNFIGNKNNANLRDLIAAICLVILLKLDSNRRFFSPCNLELDGWPRKIIGHLFYATSSFVHHFKSIGEFKLDLQSGNTQFGSKLAIFLSRVILKLMNDLGKQHGTSSILHQTLCIILKPSVISITLKSNRAPLL